VIVGTVSATIARKKVLSSYIMDTIASAVTFFIQIIIINTLLTSYIHSFANCNAFVYSLFNLIILSFLNFLVFHWLELRQEMRIGSSS